MSQRRYGWKYKPTARDLELMDEALSARLFMVSEIGPTQFLIKGEDSPAKFKVTIGEEQTCSGCTKKAMAAAMAASGAGAGAKIVPELCVHIYFVMLKVLRLSRDNSLVWQLSLLDTEISNILSSRYQRLEERAARRRMAVAAAGGSAAATSASSASAAGSSTAAAASSKQTGPARVAKRDIDPDDVCPICQDELIDPFSEAGILLRSQPAAPAMLNLVFCQFGCGQQLHAKCMRVWAEHQLASGGSSAKPLACPMCRAQWGGPDAPGQLTNEQIVREIKMQEYAVLAPPAAAASDEESNDASSTALVPRAAARSSLAVRSSSSSKVGVKCCACRKILLLSEGRFMRCVHCGGTGYDLCRVCFIRSKGIGGGTVPTALLTARANHVHAFVEMKPNAGAAAEEKSNYPYAYGSEWLPAPVKAPPLSSQLALALQGRELTHADYELLLELDENVRHNGRGMMHSYLVRTLPVPALRDGKECVLCHRSVLGSQSVRILPCFHQVHESCLQSGLMYDWLLSCPEDQAPIFPGLAFCEAKSMNRKKKTAATDLGAMEERSTAAGAMGLQIHNSFGSGSGGVGAGIVGNSGLSGTRSLASEEPDLADDIRGSSNSAAVVPHSHHFQIGTAATQRLNATTAPTGRIRTGTAAFAIPSRDARHSSDAASMQLAGGSSFAPFAADEPSLPATAASSAIRRGRPLDDRGNSVCATLSAAAATAAASLPADFSSLAVGAGSTPARSAASKGIRAHGLSSMFAPPSHSPSLSPAYSPTGLDALAISASGIQGDSTAAVGAPSTVSSGRSATGARPRVGRALPPNASPERAPPLSQLLIGSGSAPAPRSSSASAIRSSIKPRQAPAARSSMDGAGIVDPSQLSLGSASGSLLSGSSARTTGSSASARIRRSTLAAASVAAAAEFRNEQFDSGDPADLGVSANRFHRASMQHEDPIAVPLVRGRASSASHSRPSAAFAPRTVPSVHASPPPPLAAASAFSLAGASFNALDRGEAVPSSAPSSTGKLRRGKTLMSGSAR